MKKDILLICGGNSSERSISLKTGKACLNALKYLGYKTKVFDPKKKDIKNLKRKSNTIVFNALHGRYGEDGTIQSILEQIKVPYTHSGALSSMLAMNKLAAKLIFLENNILTPKYFQINESNFFKNKKKLSLILKKFKFPIVIKPNNDGSSIGVTINNNKKEFLKNLKLSLKKFENILIEEFIGGQEIQVAVLNGKALGAIELIPKRKFYDYKAKYSSKAKTSHIMPANVKKNFYFKVLKIAEKAHKILKCRGVTRSDFKFYNKKFYLLETNTQPGMTKLSLVPEIASYKGIKFPNLIKEIIKDASINK